MVYGQNRFTMALATLALGLGGCVATESWVTDQLKPIQSQVAQLNSANTQDKTGLAQVNTRVTQLDGRVNQVDTRVTQVDGRVAQVATDVTAVRKMTDESALVVAAVNARVTSALANRFNRQVVEIVSLRFGPGQFKLLPFHQEALQRVVKTLGDNHTFTADVMGFTDGIGSDAANLTLSWHREESVRRFLAEHAKALNRLAFIGLGEDMTAGDKNNPDLDISRILHAVGSETAHVPDTQSRAVIGRNCLPAPSPSAGTELALMSLDETDASACDDDAYNY